MKVLMLTQDFPPMDGGIAVFVQHICQELIRNKIHVEVLAQNGENSQLFDNTQSYTIHRYSVRGWLSSLSPIIKTVSHGLKYRSNIIFCGHMLSTYGLGAWLASKIFRIPYVVLIHGFDLVGYWCQSWIDNFTSNLILKNASLVFANSEYTKNVVLEKLGSNISKVKVEIIRPGVDIHLFRQGIDTSAIKQKYGITNERIILTVSRLVPKKNHYQVLKALPEVLEKVPDLKYVIVGEGVERVRLEDLVRQLGIKDKVIFTGAVAHSELPPYYCLCDIFVMPSCISGNNFESFGIAFLEASACAKPVVGSNSGGIPEAVINGETGLLVDPTDIEEIAEALIKLLTDKDYSQTLGENGRQRAEREFSWRMVGEKVIKALEGLGV